MAACSSSSATDSIDYTVKYQPNRPYRVLSIDGGGIRGVIPGCLLAEIEKRTHQAASDLFDLTAGTSIGSLVAMGINIPDDKDPFRPKYQASDLVKIFDTQATTVFGGSWWRTISSLNGVWSSKYSREGLDSVVDTYIGKTLLKNSLCEVLIPSYEITTGVPWFFTRQEARSNPSYENITIGDVVKSSSAAPTYFDPYEVTAFKVNKWNPVFVDGGMSNNNPAIDAYFMARGMCKKPEDMVVCSLGTGHTVTEIPYSQIRRWGVTQWATKIMTISMDGNSETVEKQLKLLDRHFHDKKQYYRFQSEIEAGRDAIDDSSAENLAYLKDCAQKTIEENDDEINTLCRELERSSSGESHATAIEFG